MKYTELLEKLQIENKGHIVLMKNGIFFTAIGKDAIELNKLLGLKLTCMREGLCKVGFQTKSLEKYVLKLKQTNKSFIIYNYDRENMQEKEILKITNEPVEETKMCNDCNKCKNKIPTDEEIIERVAKLGTN